MAKKKKADDMLGALNAQLGGGKFKSNAKAARPELKLLESTQDLLIELAGITEVFNIVDKRKSILSDEFKSETWEQFTDHWFAVGSRPKNPKVVHDDSQGIFQLKAMFKVIVPEDGDVDDALKAAGFEKKIRDKIIDENVDYVIETGPRPFNELLHGHYVRGEGGRQFIEATEVEQSAANKILAFITAESSGKKVSVEPLTFEERQVSITRSERHIVKAGFMERAATYCKNAVQLRALLTVIKPQVAVSHLKFAEKANAKEKIERMQIVFNSLFAEV